MSLVSVVFCRVEATATGRSLVRRSPTECAVSERDFETSTMRRPRLLGLSSHEKNKHCQLSGLLNYNFLSPWKEESYFCGTVYKRKELHQHVRMWYSLFDPNIESYTQTVTYPVERLTIVSSDVRKATQLFSYSGLLKSVAH